jgi:hypothetical protein
MTLRTLTTCLCLFAATAQPAFAQPVEPPPKQYRERT